jgi:DNA-directed RNA polymerase subunit K/omega
MISNNEVQAAGLTIFEFVLVSSERIREINRKRRNNGEYALAISERSKLKKPHVVAVEEITSGKIGKEYLRKVGERALKGKY